MFAGMLSDARFGVRQFRKNPRFLCAAAGDPGARPGSDDGHVRHPQALLLRPLPFPEPQQLLALWGQHVVLTPGDVSTEAESSSVSLLDFEGWTAGASTLAHACIVKSWLYSLASEGQPAEGVVGALASGGFFPMEAAPSLLLRFAGIGLMRIPVLRGRAFLPSDEANSAPVTIISQRLAHEYFRGADPIGRRIRHASHDEAFRQIVGVVGDVRRRGLGAPMVPETYVLVGAGVDDVVIVVRSDQPQRLLEELPRLVASVDPVIGVWPRRMTERMQDTLREEYRVSVVLGVFAAAALLLATLGLYALVSYSTGLKTREFGIRAALGSPPFRLVWLVMRGGLIWLVLGSGLGLVAALVLGKALALGIPAVHAFDLGVYTRVALSLGLSGALASFVPALRAVRVSPALALRYE
jgi:hypothetical protein